MSENDIVLQMRLVSVDEIDGRNHFGFRSKICGSFRRCAGMCMPVQVLCSRFKTVCAGQCQRQQRNDNPHYASSSERCCRNYAGDTHRKDSRITSCQISFADAGYK